MKSILTILIISISFALSAQVKLNTPLPCIYWMSDTSTTSTGTFKTSTALVKKKGFVVYKQDAAGLITYSYLDASKKALDKKYFVAFDDKGSAALTAPKTTGTPVIDTFTQDAVFKMALRVVAVEDEIYNTKQTLHIVDSALQQMHWKLTDFYATQYGTMNKNVGHAIHETERLDSVITAIRKTIPPIFTTKVKDGLAVDSSGALVLDPVLLALLKKLFNLQ